MSADLAARVRATLDDRAEQAQLVVDLLGPQVNVVVDQRAYPDAALAEFMDANSPSSVLRQVEGLRQIVDRHSDVSDDNHAGVCACEFDWPCPTVLSVAFMLGVTPEEEEQET